MLWRMIAAALLLAALSPFAASAHASAPTPASSLSGFADDGCEPKFQTASLSLAASPATDAVSTATQAKSDQTGASGLCCSGHLCPMPHVGLAAIDVEVRWRLSSSPPVHAHSVAPASVIRAPALPPPRST